MAFKQFRDQDGCYSYLIYCENTKEAALVDPNHSPDLYLTALDKLGLNLVYLIDTHTHVDHDSLSGILAEKTGAKVVMHPSFVEQRKLGATFSGNDAIVKHLAVNSAIIVDITPQDHGTLRVGGVEILCLHTPGHTLDSLSLVVENKLLTGDILMIGNCGRSDFPGGSNEDMYDSLYNKLSSLGEDLAVYPAHDYQNNINSSLGYEISNNPFLKHPSKEDFIKFARDSFAKLPSMATQGDKIQCSLPPASETQVQKSVPVPSSTTVSNPLMGQMCSAMEYYFKNIPQHWNLVNSEEMLQIIKDKSNVLIIDVRQPQEFAEGRIPGSENIPVRDLPNRIKDLPTNLERPIITTCESGSRSAYAAMFLRGYGYSHVRSLELGMHSWREKGYPIEK
ncbi:MBL fold metallo-hydrolase [Desulforamulus aquiferis]|uniref:MBL fold metallo-hydrolase n=1 Tax=Desulforamulus aquiferis TaxID=1397668 RepID=A0AAW7ZIG4_9FIRM|nr:MBL fold metallo-hydrolase [Desulforamulus aquiferis]MDO7788691.1 MBL fold metallo-hydrolase [Desulforamulus aquiferis]RYD06482.1 hypothetical protein N752_03915 [Desulforamulus aquiferis]